MSHIPPDYARSPVFDHASRPHPGLDASRLFLGHGRGGGWCLRAGRDHFCVTEQSPPCAPDATAPQVAALSPPVAVPPKPALVVAPPQPIVIQPAAAATPQAAPQVTSDPHAPAMVVDFSQSPGAAGAAP